MAPSPSSSLAGSCKDDIRHISIPSVSNFIRQFSTSGIAVAVATGVTHPIDVVKVRLQMEYVGQRGPLTGMTKTFVQLIKNEGLSTLYSGLAPALSRSFVYGGLRLGLYEPCKYVSDSAFGHTGIVTNFASGAFSGSLATALTNPTEILKVRLQMKKGSGSQGSVHELSHIVATEGITGLWKGVGPAMTRAAVLTASQLATYDESKQLLKRWTSLKEGFFLHLSASTIAGIMGTLATAPVDTIKTRLMMQRESAKIGIYKNGFHCAYKVMLSEGLKGLYKGAQHSTVKLGFVDLEVTQGTMHEQQLLYLLRGAPIAGSTVDQVEQVIGYVSLGYPFGMLASILFGRHHKAILQSPKPKLFVMGTSDGFTSVKQLKDKLKTAAGRNEIHLIPKAGHFQMEGPAYDAQMADLIDTFSTTL